MATGADAVDLAAFAATRAALDPQRQEVRSDILISAIVENLARRGPRRTSELRADLREIWVATSAGADLAAIEDACALAVAANLVVREERHKEVVWRAADGAKIDAAQDRDWARGLLQRFERDVAERLAADFPELVDVARIPRLTRQLIRAMVKASSGVLQAVAQSGRPESLREVKLSLRQVATKLETEINPQWLAQAVAGLALAAADPGDDFGEDMLRLIVTGQVLHGMAKRRDLAPVPTEPVTLVTDTSVLVDLLGHEPPARELLDRLLAQCARHGITIVVTPEVVGEWKRLWDAAADEVLGWSTRGVSVADRNWMHAPNPAVRAWLFNRVTQTELTFAGFAGQWRDIEARLPGLGFQLDVEALPTPDAEVRSAVKAWLDKNTTRSEVRASVDADSAAQVAALRAAGRHSPVPTGWFLAKEWFTGQAYAAVAPDDAFPLVTSPAAWLVYVQASYRMEVSEKQDLAEAIGSAVVLESFLNVASGFTLDDLLRIGDLLHQPDLSEEDLRDAVRTSYLDLTEEASLDVKVQAFTSRRVRRRDRRASEALEAAERRQRDATAALVAAKNASAQREEQMERRQAAIEARLARAEDEREKLQAQNDLDRETNAAETAEARREAARRRRERNVAVAAVITAAVVVPLVIWGGFSTLTRWFLGLCAITAWTAGSLNYVTSDKRRPLLATAVGLMLGALTVALGAVSGEFVNQLNNDEPIKSPGELSPTAQPAQSPTSMGPRPRVGPVGPGLATPSSIR